MVTSSKWALSSALMVSCMLMTACSEDEKTTNKQQAPVTAEKQVSSENSVTSNSTSSQAETPPPATQTAQQSQQEEPSKPVPPLVLARNSGCLACHRVDKKLVGPAWKDVSKKYKGDSTARNYLVEKIKKGGKGVWKEITHGAAMPPYSPRVKDKDIQKLVDFVLSL